MVILAARVAAGFVTFEVGQVRPLALSPDGRTLLALNTPDARLEVFAIDDGDLSHVGSVPVGLQPVAVAARSDTEVWVVNHLSDSISIVDLGSTPPRVVRTLLVGDEPRDIVFAGPLDGSGRFRRAFITTARVGQNLPDSVPPNLTTPGTPRALVYVFDAANLGPALGGTPETIIELFGDTPRALAAAPDGATVYAAVFHSGNQTTAVTEGAVCDGGAAAGPCDLDGVQVPGGLPGAQVPGGLPAPNENTEGTPGPEVGLIVKRNPANGLWEDTLGRNWTNAVRFDLPDRDVFRIDALANPPRESAAFAHVGTILFNMAVHPVSGTLYVSNTEARNEVRFEGFSASRSSVRGDLHEARITVIDGATVQPRHLNAQIRALPDGYRTIPMPAAVEQASLATPLDMVLASDGTMYVAAFGSSKVAALNTAELDTGTFVPDAADHIEVSGGGPAGLALAEAHQRLYVLTRFDNAVKVIDTTTRLEIAQHPLHNPEPPQVLAGRRFLYDARATSSNGEASCSSCHVFADFDSLAWDLGNPDGVVVTSYNPLGPTGLRLPFHPLKGPMATQTLRGLVHQGPMHWRGDRTGATRNDDELAYDASLAFKAFNVAFESLLGRDEGELSEADMQSFTDFALRIMPPPNPVRALDNSLTEAQALGRELFLDRRIFFDPAANCSGCHTLNASRGQFGTLGATTFEDEPQEFKIPQLKNMYTKVGMFGTPSTHFAHIPPDDAEHQGEQIRGFGFLHDGSFATVSDFLQGEIFTMNDLQRGVLEQFMLAFDTTFAPIVGQQITLTADNAAVVGMRIDLLTARAMTRFTLIDQPDAMECDLVAKAVVGGEARGYLLNVASGAFQSDRVGEPAIAAAQLRGLANAAGHEVTYTCVPPGEGARLGIDRDGDTLFDRDEIDAGTDPADPRDPFLLSPTPRPTSTRTPSPSRTPSETETPRVMRPTRTVSPTASATSLTTPTPTPTPALRGDADCNGVVDASDPTAACVAMFDRTVRPGCDADCNRDGAVTAADATCVVGFLAGAPAQSSAPY